NRDLFRSQLRGELGIPQDAFVMLFAGRDWLRKGLHHAINSLALLRNPRLYLVVVGDDDKRRLLPLLLDDLDGDNVKFVPYARQIAPYYAAADIFVLPSYSESFSLVCYEAAASGLPVLATKLPGIEDLIEDGENGFFIEHDSQDIARKVKLLYSDPRLREQMGIKARAKAERFSWDECARKMELLLLEIHQKGRFYAS
ncbi:MAG: glycosyltransferase family 4 protein, partial [Chloroflexota bacterium]|nr:glycosyltransferase family 4 protein [Chloroflexota bacterium]